MRLDKIEVGKWYRTKVGIGQCMEAQRWTPPARKFRIVYPFPRGLALVSPRDVLEEVEALPEGATEPPLSWRE
jgi:hypothetical protein